MTYDRSLRAILAFSLNYMRSEANSEMNSKKCAPSCGFLFHNSISQSARSKQTFPRSNPEWIVSKPTVPNSCQLVRPTKYSMVKSVTHNWRLVLSVLGLISISGCTTTPEEKLRLAAADGNLLRVRTFLEQGITAQSADERGVTPILLAAKNGHRNVVALLLEQGAAVNPTRQDGVTPLFVAVQEGHREVVALLLEKGVDVNAQARIGGVTPLHVGAYRGDQTIVTLLLQHGADKNARMSSGERPVDLAQQQGHAALIPLLEP